MYRYYMHSLFESPVYSIDILTFLSFNRAPFILRKPHLSSFVLNVCLLNGMGILWFNEKVDERY